MWDVGNGVVFHEYREMRWSARSGDQISFEEMWVENERCRRIYQERQSAEYPAILADMNLAWIGP
jgi:hypothetical protein